MQLQDNADDSVPKHFGVEVHEKADTKACELQVRKNLSCMNRSQTLDGLELDKNALFYNEVQAIASLDVNALVDERKCPLTFQR
jgi:hypothetical protein